MPLKNEKKTKFNTVLDKTKNLIQFWILQPIINILVPIAETTKERI
jgi:hypothetical protein